MTGEVASSPARTPPGWARQVLLVLAKDLAIEMRTGEVVATSGFFAVLVAVTSSMSFYTGPDTARMIASGAIWLSVAFAAVLSLGRTWQREREEAAIAGLLATPLSRSALFAGKALGLAVFLFAVEALVIPVAAILFSVDLAARAPGLAAVVVVTTPGIAAAGTLFGAMTVRTRARDLVLAIVLFPLLAPTLLAAVVATRELFDGAPFSEVAATLELALVFDVVVIALGLGMFGSLIED